MARKVAPVLDKPKPDKRGPERAPRKRARPAKTDDPVEKTERYMAATSGTNGHVANEGLMQAKRLKDLIVPHTAAMVQVMIDIANDTQHKTDASKYPSIHASIRLEAADRVLNRAYGKPKETLVTEDEGGNGVEGDEVLKLLNGILEHVGAPVIKAT